MPPKVTKRWVPVNRAEGASSGGGGGDPATTRRSALPDVPLQHRLVPQKSATPLKSTLRWVPVNRAGGTAASRGQQGGNPDADPLSALPDALLHHIMSFLKVWAVVQTCVLSRRWRNLWASAPFIDICVHSDDCGEIPEDFPDFVRHFFRCRDVSAKLDTLHLRSSDVDGAHNEDDARLWIRTAIKQGARVIHLVGHRKEDWLRGRSLAVLEHASFVSCQLKILKLSYALIDDNILSQLSSHCPSLEEMNLKDCLIAGHGISSASLKVLTMFKCQISVNLSIAAPNLVVLRCISPITQVPSFENMASLVIGTIVLDDYAFGDDFEDFSKDEFDGTTDEDDDCNDGTWKKTRYGFGAPLERYWSRYKVDYGSDIESDDNTFEYSEIAIDCDEYGINGDGHNSAMDGNRQISGENSGCNDSKSKGGHNVLQSLSNATSLELLADAGEVILTRELKRCPCFSNLKTLSLGEWSMDAGFDALVFLLQHSPNLERLFLELKLNSYNKKPLVSSVKPKEKSFACNHLQLVKVKCSKDDARVHKLAHLFRTNGISVDKIFVRRSGSAYLRGKKFMKDLARHELEFWGM